MLKSRWRILGVVLGILLLITAALAIWIRAVADRRWAELRADVEAMQREMRTPGGERPVLLGTAEPGNAWDDYGVALAEVNRIKASDALDLQNFMSRDRKVDWADVEPVIAAHRTALEQLRRGARRILNDRNPFGALRLVAVIMGGDLGPHQMWAEIRLLRIAVRYRATGEILELDDPFGTKMILERNGPRLKAWSIEADEVDNRGLVGEPVHGKERDLVIEVDR